MYYVDEESRGYIFTIETDRTFSAREVDIPAEVGAKAARITREFNELQEYLALLHRSPLRMHRGFPLPKCLEANDGGQKKEPKTSGKGRRVSQQVRDGGSK